MVTKYGTLPTSAAPSSSSSLDSSLRTALASRRPWRLLLDPRALSFPPTPSDAYHRLRSNAHYFAVNYAIVVLLLVILSLLFSPISLVVFLALMAAWLFFYVLRDEPPVLLGRPVGEVSVLGVLSVVTLVVLLVSGATVDILFAVVAGVVVVVVHAAARRADDRVFEADAKVGGLGVHAAVVVGRR